MQVTYLDSFRLLWVAQVPSSTGRHLDALMAKELVVAVVRWQMLKLWIEARKC